METPAPLETAEVGGADWSFAHEREASKFADHLTRRYHTAKVQHLAVRSRLVVRVHVLDEIASARASWQRKRIRLRGGVSGETGLG